MDNSNYYEVEKILGHRENGGQRQYYIKWKGYSSQDNTWEPEKNLKSCNKLLKSYNRIKRLPLSSNSSNVDTKVKHNVWNPSESGCSGKSDVRNVSSIKAMNDRTSQLDPSTQLSSFSRNDSKGKETAFTIVAGHAVSREERARIRQLRAHTEGGVRKRLKKTHQKSLMIPFKFHKRKTAPEILEATQVRGELCFVVKWPKSEQLELIASTIMYVEYPLYVFKFYEKCLSWVQFDKS